MKKALSLASLLLVAGTTVGCGGDGGGGAPDNASQEDFCDAYMSVFDDLDLESPPSDEEAVRMMKDWGERMSDTGTPEDMSDDARQGFELMVDTLDEVEEDVSAADLEKLGEDWSAEQEKQGEAFQAYVGENCEFTFPGMDDLEGEMSDLESEMGELTESP
jgi:hypothetical protein